MATSNRVADGPWPRPVCGAVGCNPRDWLSCRVVPLIPPEVSMRSPLMITAACCALLAALVATARATHPLPNETITVFLNGQSEVGPNGQLGAGDLDGSAIARLENDHGMLLWTMDYQNISGQSLSGLHIHGPGATPTTNRPIFIDLPILIDLPAPGITLPNGSIFGTVTSLDDPALPTKLAQVFGNPSEFYLNLHTGGAGGFPDGAVRGQLPEPSTASLLLGAGLLGLRRRSVPTERRSCRGTGIGKVSPPAGHREESSRQPPATRLATPAFLATMGPSGGTNVHFTA